MNKYTLSFINKSLEQEYFNKIAFPQYFQIFSSWCKILIIISIPCSLFTFFTGNKQYLGFCWCIVSSFISLFIVNFKKNSFNIVVAIYNTGFVFLNISFIMLTDKNIGAEGSLNNMMFIFAGNQYSYLIQNFYNRSFQWNQTLFLIQKGSQYIFHFILSIGSNFILNSSIIFIQNFSYSALFFPGQLNSFHGLLFFSMCFLIWMKYKNEKYQRDLFLLQEKEREVNQFVRDVLPTSVFILKYDPIKDQIQKELVNRAAQQEYNIKDDSLLTQFLRNTILQADVLKKQKISTSVTRVSSKGRSPTIGQFSPFQNVQQDTLENYIQNKFRLMTKQDNKSIKDDQIQMMNNNNNNIDVSQINIEQKQFDKKINSVKEQINNSIIFKNKKIQLNLFSQQSCKDQSQQISLETSSREIFNIKSKFNNKNNNTNKTSQKLKDKNNKLKKLIEKVYQQEEKEKEKYNIQEFDAYIIKNNVKIDVLVKVVFYYLSYPVCSVCIDEGLKQQIVRNDKQQKMQESIYLQHLTKISQKFQKIIQFQNILSYSLLYFNHLKNIQDFVQLKQHFKFKINYTTFQLSALLKYIQNMFQPIFVSQNIDFSIQICQNQSQEQNQNLSIKEVQTQSINDNNKENFSFTGKNQLIQEIGLGKLNNSQFNKQSEVFNYLDDVSENIEIYNEQQRVCQILINLLENSLEYLSKQNINPKYVKLLVKVIEGKDNNSNLIEFKVINNTQLNYSKQDIYSVKDSLKIEREIKFDYFQWNPQSVLKPTQIGLKLNQKILEKTSPFSYMNIDCEEDKICFSFYIYQNFNIVLPSEKQIFQNKLFDEIRESQICEDRQLSENQDQSQKQIHFQIQNKDNQKLSKFFESENCENEKKSFSINYQDSILNDANIDVYQDFQKSIFEEKEIDEKIDQKYFEILVFNSKNSK